MTREQMVAYAEKMGYRFNGVKNYKGFYTADKANGEQVAAATLQGLKNMIDTFGGGR